MRRRAAFLVAVVVLSPWALVGCGGDSEEAGATPSDRLSPTAPSDPVTEISVPCAEFEAVSKRIADAQGTLYDGSTTAIEDLVDELQALKDGAPDDVRGALDDLVDAFRIAQEVVADPSEENAARLSELGPRLSAAGQLVTSYIVDQCR